MSAMSDRYPYSEDQQVWLRTKRLFYVDPSENSSYGWYFKVRGQRFIGPFPSKREAENALNQIITRHRDNNETSGR